LNFIKSDIHANSNAYFFAPETAAQTTLKRKPIKRNKTGGKKKS